jgi:hypothetical protein
MVPSANICAILILVVAPFVQPCFCVDFKLFCQCDATAAETVCCETTGDEQAPTCPETDPEKDTPCTAIQVQTGPFVSTPTIATSERESGLAEALPGTAVAAFTPVIASDNRPPPAIGLLVVRTQFLRI